MPSRLRRVSFPACAFSPRVRVRSGGTAQESPAASARGPRTRACPRGGAAPPGAAQQVDRSVRSPAPGQRTGCGAAGGVQPNAAGRGARMRAGNFSPGLEVRAAAPEGAPRGGRERGERGCPSPPLPHFRRPPLPRSRLPGPGRPAGAPAAQPHPGRRASLPRPRSRLAGAQRPRQRGRGALQVGAPRQGAQRQRAGRGRGPAARTGRPGALGRLSTPPRRGRAPALFREFSSSCGLQGGGAETGTALCVSRAPRAPQTWSPFSWHLSSRKQLLFFPWLRLRCPLGVALRVSGEGWGGGEGEGGAPAPPVRGYPHPPSLPPLSPPAPLHPAAGADGPRGPGYF